MVNLRDKNKKWTFWTRSHNPHKPDYRNNKDDDIHKYRSTLKLEEKV